MILTLDHRISTAVCTALPLLFSFRPLSFVFLRLSVTTTTVAKDPRPRRAGEAVPGPGGEYFGGGHECASGRP